MKRRLDYNFEYNLNKKRRTPRKKPYEPKPAEEPDNESDLDDLSDYDDDFLTMNRNEVTIKENRIYFKAKVCDQSVDKLIQILDEKNKKFGDIVHDQKLIKSATPNPIYLHITSFGGSLLSCFRAIDAIRRSKIPIHTVIDGHAASAGTLMSVVGKKRYMTPHSYVLIHQLSSGGGGTYWQIKDDFKNCKKMMDDIYNIYTTHTKMSKEELVKQLKHDLWWKADICIEKGLVDEIYDENCAL